MGKGASRQKWSKSFRDDIINRTLAIECYPDRTHDAGGRGSFHAWRMEVFAEISDEIEVPPILSLTDTECQRAMPNVLNNDPLLVAKRSFAVGRSNEDVAVASRYRRWPSVQEALRLGAEGGLAVLLER